MSQGGFQQGEAESQAAVFGRGVRFLILLCAVTFPVAFWVLVNPATARAAWAEVARIIPFKGQAGSKGAAGERVSEMALAKLGPQQQAEVLLRAAIDNSPRAEEQIRARVPAWRGRLESSPQLTSLVETALNSPELHVRATGIQVELGLNNLGEDSASANALIARVHSDPAARPWGLWMLGALGGRGVETGRILPVLSGYTRDPNQQTRFWAVEGLSLLGNNESIPPLLTALRSDASQPVRESAASALGRSGMLRKEQRLSAVPALIDDASDGSLDPATHRLAYAALHDITGARVADTPAAWRAYWAEKNSR